MVGVSFTLVRAIIHTYTRTYMFVCIRGVRVYITPEFSDRTKKKVRSQKNDDIMRGRSVLEFLTTSPKRSLSKLNAKKNRFSVFKVSLSRFFFFSLLFFFFIFSLSATDVNFL